MYLVERHVIKRSNKNFKEYDHLAYLSKNLYNRANYIVRQEFINNSNYLCYRAINRLMIDSNDENYIALPRKVSNKILQLLDKNWLSFFRAIKDWKRNPSKYNGKPKLPNYKDVKKGRNVVPYEKGAISKSSLIKNGLIHLSKTNIYVKTKVSYETLVSAKIINRLGHYVIDVIYKKEVEEHNLNYSNVMGIDIGVNNLAAVITTTGDAFLINGKPIKSINQYFNKKKAKMQSKLPKNQYSSNKINQLSNKRGRKINDYLHKSSRYIIDYCLTHNIGKIVIGKNKGWKDKASMGKRNNQKFVSIPFARFISMIEYKGELVSIEVITREESYTSKCSFIDNEEVRRHSAYVGSRIKRGLFKTQKGLLLNADINGALNITKKEVPLFTSELWNRGCAVHPISITSI